MIRKLCSAAILLIVFGFGAFAQNSKYNQSDSAVAARLKKDISLLASDSLEGREAGTDGEAKAKQYIENQFKEIGLQPLFVDNTSYFQPFDVNGGAAFNTNTLTINGTSFEFKEDFYPLDYSANAEVKGEIVKVGYGITAPELKYDDYKNLKDVKDKIVIMRMYLSDSLLKISGFSDYKDPKVRIKSAIEKGASAVILITSNSTELGPPQKLSENTIPLSIPCIYADKKAVKLIKAATNLKAELEVNVKRAKSKTAYNIGGYINNNAKFTVVIGAHYDHLGYTTTSTGKKIVNNGADDNASGTAAMIELARYFSDTTKERYNLVFLAFSAEEKGLYGSQYFVESNAIDLSKVAFMMNCDMVGRLDSVKKKVIIYSIGSSPVWKKILASTDSASLKIDAKEAAESGSDHYSFYEKNIPDVFFFTDLHADYHKPTDDSWKINFAGEAHIVKYIERFFNAVKGNKKLPFSRTISYW